MNKKKNNRSESRASVVGGEIFILFETYNPSTEQFKNLLTLNMAGFGAYSDVLTKYAAMYNLWKINRISFEMADLTNTTAGIVQPYVLTYAPSSIAAITSMADVENLAVSNVAGGSEKITTATQASSLILNPGKLCKLTMSNADFVTPSPGGWLSTQGALPDTQYTYGQLWSCGLLAGTNASSFKRYLRVKYEISFKILTDIAVISRPSSKPVTPAEDDCEFVYLPRKLVRELTTPKPVQDPA